MTEMTENVTVSTKMIKVYVSWPELFRFQTKQKSMFASTLHDSLLRYKQSIQSTAVCLNSFKQNNYAYQLNKLIYL